MNEGEYYTYILWSQKLNKYYVGLSSDLQKRLIEHNSGKAKFTSKGIPWSIAYSEKYNSKKEAADRERYIKRMKSRKFIEDLIKKQMV